MTELASGTTTDFSAAEAAGKPELPGHNRISTQALTSVAQAVASEALDIPAGQVRAGWRDDGGLLALSLVLPASIPSLTRVLRDPSLLDHTGGSVWDRALAARGVILANVIRLTGSQLSRVDIRFTGVRVKQGGRVQ